MIIAINPNLFNSVDNVIQKNVSKIIECFFEDYFIWDKDNIDDIFIGDFSIEDTICYKNFLSKFEQNLFITRVEEIFQLSAYQTPLHNKYLTKISIGLEDNEINPERALEIITKESKIILENGNNDWKFILGMVEKYHTHKNRKSIYALIRKAIDNNRLTAENAGGIGGIIPRIDAFIAGQYKDIINYKVCIMFDSDRPNANILSNAQQRIIRKVKGGIVVDVNNAVFKEDDLLCWHMLYKRSIENYLPISVLGSNLPMPASILDALTDLSPNDLDFFYYDEGEYTGYGIDLKNQFPDLFQLHWTRDLIEDRCRHHKANIELPNQTIEEVCEIEELLLKIAKII